MILALIKQTIIERRKKRREEREKKREKKEEMMKRERNSSSFVSLQVQYYLPFPLMNLIITTFTLLTFFLIQSLVFIIVSSVVCESVFAFVVVCENSGHKEMVQLICQFTFQLHHGIIISLSFSVSIQFPLSLQKCFNFLLFPEQKRQRKI